MSAKLSEVPDAWDDNWESQVDVCRTKEQLSTTSTPPPEKKVSSKVTKAQRRAQQAEFNRQLWAEAESPETFHFVETRSNVPLKQDLKPTVTVLSRKPQIATRQSSSSAVDAAAVGVGQLELGADDDSDEEANKPPEPTPEERQATALKNREEKQRKYEEVRERLLGVRLPPARARRRLEVPLHHANITLARAEAKEKAEAAEISGKRGIRPRLPTKRNISTIRQAPPKGMLPIYRDETVLRAIEMTSISNRLYSNLQEILAAPIQVEGAGSNSPTEAHERAR
ncbi:hypothetical protein NUU61_007975, partial [Penicillium alfredii]